jgi:hypothetical protein
MSFNTFPLKQRAPGVHSQELPNMSDSARTVRRRTNISTISSSRWSDEDRTRLWQLRQEQSHLTWNQLYNVWHPISSISTLQAPVLFDDKLSHCSSKEIRPLFPGRSRAAITQECQVRPVRARPPAGLHLLTWCREWKGKMPNGEKRGGLITEMSLRQSSVLSVIIQTP